MDGIVRYDLPNVVWKNKNSGDRGIEKITKGTKVHIIDKFYNYCINGCYYRVRLKDDGRVYYMFPIDVEAFAKGGISIPERRFL